MHMYAHVYKSAAPRKMAALEGTLMKMERDYSDEVDKQLPRCKELATVRTWILCSQSPCITCQWLSCVNSVPLWLTSIELCLHDGATCSSVALFACITERARVGCIGAATCLGEEDAPGETTVAHVHVIFPVAGMCVLFVMLNYSIIICHLLSSMF